MANEPNYSSNPSKDEPKKEKVRVIPLEYIDEFPGHPFKVLDDESMQKLMNSIEEIGVQSPIVARIKEDQRYEIISGHRRVHACRRLGLKLIPAIVRDLSRDEAIIAMVDANLQREHILPSEKAAAYKMKMDALNRQGKRTDLTSRPVGEKLSAEVVGEECNDSARQVQRYAEMIKQAQRTAIMRDPTMAAATLVGAQADAMKAAASNEGGAMNGFIGMGMAMNAGGMNAQNLFAMGQQQTQQTASSAPDADGWKCACGATATGKFCPECGAKKPELVQSGAWKCKCGAAATGKFCPECGSPKPAENGWACSCGAVNKGKFCQNCGARKPEGAPLYRCDKCGWEPEDPHNPPKFCPECGDLFDDNDKK